VCYPGSANMDHALDVKTAGRVKRSADTTPCILHLNSLRKPKPHVLRRIKQYLQDEWARRKAAERGPRDFSGLMDTTPPCPQQRNMCDCGVFVLEFLERLLSAPLPTLPELAAATPAERLRFLRDRSGWFAPRDVAAKRAAIRDLIHRPR
jgi:Ulp1 family protease